MRPCHVPDARGKTVGPALSVSFARVPAPIRLLGRYPPAYDRNLARVSRRAARPTIAAGQAAAAGPASPLVSTLLAVLIAGLLGLPAGAAALALARRHCRRQLPARPLASPGGMVLGDVKFALVLALALGWLGWSAVVAGFVGAFPLGGLAALGAMLILQVGRKTQLPFGPWLALGALLAILAAAPVPPT